jgi:hypothetical protein
MLAILWLSFVSRYGKNFDEYVRRESNRCANKKGVLSHHPFRIMDCGKVGHWLVEEGTF